MSIPRARRRFTLALVTATALISAACSDDSTASSDTSTTTSRPTTPSSRGGDGTGPTGPTAQTEAPGVWLSDGVSITDETGASVATAPPGLALHDLTSDGADGVLFLQCPQVPGDGANVPDTSLPTTPAPGAPTTSSPTAPGPGPTGPTADAGAAGSCTLEHVVSPGEAPHSMTIAGLDGILGAGSTADGGPAVAVTVTDPTRTPDFAQDRSNHVVEVVALDGGRSIARLDWFGWESGPFAIDIERGRVATCFGEGPTCEPAATATIGGNAAPFGQAGSIDLLALAWHQVAAPEGVPDDEPAADPPSDDQPDTARATAAMTAVAMPSEQGSNDRIDCLVLSGRNDPTIVPLRVRGATIDVNQVTTNGLFVAARFDDLVHRWRIDGTEAEPVPVEPSIIELALKPTPSSAGGGGGSPL